MVRFGAAAMTGYLLGTAPSADWAARLAGGRTDLREAGSGNPGAANAMAQLGKGWGAAVLAADVAKAATACAVGRRLAGPTGGQVAGVAAVVGHCYPAWNGFRGGKGVAASAGQCLATFPVYFPVDLAVAAGSATWRRQAYAASVVASVAWVAAGVLWWRRQWPNAWGPEPTVALPLGALATSAVVLHRFRQAARAQGSGQ